MTSFSGFRTDINGVRALAVSAVLVYHFASSYLPGGFAGVDVFFVISGFLMTSIIVNNINNNKFSLFNFYLARFRRIVPPLLVLCLVLAVFGWFFFPPLYFESLHKHIAGSISFISNILYMRESGYFDSGVQEKWLLHTWSLSVEWQFYIIYPIILLGLFKVLSFKHVKLVIVTFTIAGTLLCIYYTDVNSKWAFYLLPVRAWEMLLGALAFFYPLSLKMSHARAIQYIGVTLIIATYIFIGHDIAWPSYWALIPTVGTLLVLLANYEHSVLNKHNGTKNSSKPY